MLPTTSATFAAGRWLALKALAQQRQQGTQAAARNLRKQGCPVHVALALLARRKL